MKGFEKDEKAVEAVRKHYNCNGKYLCTYFHDCCECGADEFYAGYMQCLFDKEREL